MKRPEFTIHEGNLTDRFMQSRADVRIFGGGFANSKTASACIMALQLASDYPGSNGLIARETVRKLNDTIREEFYKWCPPGAIKGTPPMSYQDSTTCVLNNGTRINFRYLQQQGKGGGQNTSNLLSATYDWAIIDQVEDPGIEYKDFDDLLGRMRGSTPYIGDDPTMPRFGPGWIILTCNPARNWVYRRLIKPLHDYQRTGIPSPDLMIKRQMGSAEAEGVPILDEQGNVIPLIELFEQTTYDNAENLPKGYIERLESTYRGTMRKRFMLGEWGAFEGLIYPDYDVDKHTLPRAFMMEYYMRMRKNFFINETVEALDHGIAVPGCYLAGFVDMYGAVFITHGYYEPMPTTGPVVDYIREARGELRINKSHDILADPQIFKRPGIQKGTVGQSTQALLSEAWDEAYPDDAGNLIFRRGNNDIINGIVKVSEYLSDDPRMAHPLTKEYGAPRIYFAQELGFIDSEMSEYMWRISSVTGEREDTPIDKNDHAMDSIKYLLSNRPKVAELPAYLDPKGRPKWLAWTDVPERQTDKRKQDGRYGYAA